MLADNDLELGKSVISVYKPISLLLRAINSFSVCYFSHEDIVRACNYCNVCLYSWYWIKRHVNYISKRPT
jgi:hypothetical protein